MTLTCSCKAAVVCLASVLLITLASPAEGAWPSSLMVYGAPLMRPLVVEDPKDIVKVFTGTRGALTGMIWMVGRISSWRCSGAMLGIGIWMKESPRAR